MTNEPLATPPAVPTPDASPRPWLLLLGVLVLTAGCYMPVLGAPFLWDDRHLIELPLVRQLAPLPRYFEGSFWQHDDANVVHSYYRPLVIVSLALDHRLYGENPSGFHLTNLLCHLAATAVLFRLLRLQGAGGPLAVACSTLWALHPRLTEAAAWISGRTDALAGFFVLCALLAQSYRTRLARWSSACLLLLGLFCKETAIAGVLAVLVGEWQRTARPSARFARLTPTLAALAAYSALRLHAVGWPTNLLHLSPGRRLLAVLEGVGHYLWMGLVPWLPDAQIGNLRRRDVPYTVLGGLILCALLVVGWRRRARFSAPQFRHLALTFGALGLALYAIPFSFSALAADRFLYLPLAGLALLAAPIVRLGMSRWRPLPWLAVAAAASFGVATFVRAGTWSDEVEFWVSTMRAHPEEPSMASIGLAEAFSREGLFGQALAVLRRAAQPRMDMRELALRNAGTTLLHSGSYDAAQSVLAELVRRHPRSATYALNLALAQLSMDRAAEAQKTLDEALHAAPADASLSSLRARLPMLAAQRRALDDWPPAAAPAARARLEQSLGLRAEAARSYGRALGDPTLSPALAQEATWFALQFGDAETREAFYNRYTALVGGKTDPRLQAAYETHRASRAKLERAWPSLGLSR